MPYLQKCEILLKITIRLTNYRDTELEMVWVPIKAFVETAYRRVVPLYSFDHRDRPYLFASSVPFQSGSMRFLITAAHCCFRDGSPLPLFVYGAKKVHPLTKLRGTWDYRVGQQPDLDIAVIALDRRCADDLQDIHWFSTPSDVSVVTPKVPGVHYLIAGYPASRNRQRPLKYGLPSRATALITGDVCSVKTVHGMDKSEEHHFAIAFPNKTISNPAGGKFHLPKPHGMSGGGVWRVDIDTLERLANRPSLVGIGVEYHKAHKTFVATNVQAVGPLVSDLADPNTHRTVI